MQENTNPQTQQASRRPMRSEELKDLIAALNKAQGAIKSATKDATNPHFDSNYATMDAVWEVVREPLANNGLAIAQTTEPGANGWLLVTTLYHVTGQWICALAPLLTDKNTCQAFGSAMTYQRRYCLMAILGVAPAEDDDGTAAGTQGRKGNEQRGNNQKGGQGAGQQQQRNGGQPAANRTASQQGPRNENTTKHGDWDRAQVGWENHPATEGQIKRMFAVSKEAGYQDEVQLKEVLFEMFGDAVLKDDKSDVTTKKLTKGMMDRLFVRLDGEIKKKSVEQK